jgi:hypothetical protein
MPPAGLAGVLIVGEVVAVRDAVARAVTPAGETFSDETNQQDADAGEVKYGRH